MLNKINNYFSLYTLQIIVHLRNLDVGQISVMSGRKVELSGNERNFLLESLRNGIRIDNNEIKSRNLNQIRIPEIFLSKVDLGYIELNWGLTKLAVRVSSKIVKPFEDRPFEGLFQINCDISSMAMKDNYSKSSEEVLVSRLIEKAIKRSNSLDLESLCIIAGEKVWSITADLNFLNFDGNFIDLACFGTMLALHHFKKNEVTVDNGKLIHHDRLVPLSILHVPICVSFLFFNNSDMQTNIKGSTDDTYLIDGNLSEELLSDGLLVVTLNKNRELIQLSKSGGLPIDALTLMDLSLQAMKIVETLTELMKTTLEKFGAERYQEENLGLLEVGADRL